MGLFSGIKKLVKKVVGGIKKVFKPILEPIAKLFNSKLGKIILIGAAVFTAGMALYAGWTAAAATQGTMMSKFLAGSKAFLSAVVNPIQNAKAALGNTGIFAEGAQIAGAGDIGIFSGNAFTQNFVPGADATFPAMDPAAGVGGAGAGPGDVLTETGTGSASVADAGASQGMFSPGGQGSVTGGAGAQMPAQVLERSPSVVPADWSAGQGGLLSESMNIVSSAASKFGRFAQSTGGGLLMSNLLKGYSEGKIAEHYEDERNRREALWSDSPELDRLREVSKRRLQVPANWAGPAGGQADPSRMWAIRQGYTHQPPVPYSSGG